MPITVEHTHLLPAQEVTAHPRKYWLRVFLVYALVEMAITLIQYSTTKAQCRPCVLPPAFYVLNWLQHLVFTAVLWYCMNRVYFFRLWKAVAANIFLFTAYYFLWISLLYFIFLFRVSGLVWEHIPYRSYTWFVYGSWADVGKYVLKCSAFYVLKFYYGYKKAEQERIQLAVMNKDMQLNLLKQQLSPHFYFNTLNNLYGLARGNSPKLETALAQLQNIMQYVIVDCNRPRVLLRNEISFLQSYIALEKLRYEQNTIIEMNVTGAATSQTIVPLLLVQFVENAFKHGMKEKLEHNWMKVQLSIKDDLLEFTVENSNNGTAAPGGIGLYSVQRILALQYENKHELLLQPGNNRFLVTLKLNVT